MSKAFAFGNTRFGKCGIGEHHNQQLNIPRQVKISHYIVSVVCSFAHTFFLTKSGELFVCGYLGDCIGLDDSDKLEKDYQIVTPTKIQALDGYHIVQVSACYQHAVAVSRDGAVFSWGVGSWYRLGHGDEKFVQFPKRIQQLSGYKAVLVSAGMTTTFIHTACGRLFAFGDSSLLGSSQPTRATITPSEVETLRNVSLKSIESSYFTMALTKTGQLFCWGRNTVGQCGVGIVSDFIKIPTLIKTQYRVVDISCGFSFGLFCTEDGNVYSIGKLPFVNTNHNYRPYLIPNLKNVKSVAAGEHHALFQTSDGSLYILQREEGVNVTLSKVSWFEDHDIRVGKVSCDSNHTVVLEESPSWMLSMSHYKKCKHLADVTLDAMEE